MTNHILTKTYSVLRGFSTDSKYKRPANISDKAINLIRLPDGTLSPRRGYQVQADDVGGLGLGIYENIDNSEVESICISRDGNLYIERTGSLTIEFNDPNNNPESYIAYEIYVDPNTVSDNQTCDFDPYLVVDDNALIDDCIKFRLQKLDAFSGVAIGSGSATYSGTLSGAPLTPGSVLMTDGTLIIQDDAVGGFIGDVGVGTNTIDYSTGDYDVTFSGVTGSVTASYRTTLQEQFNTCMGKGYGINNPFSVTQLINQLNTITGITTTSSGNTSKPAAFIEIVEETNIADGESVTLNWYYWESANRTLSSTFAGLAAQLNNDNFRIATFAPFEEAVYIATGYDQIQKYDGQTVYRAGMPQGSIDSVANSGGGTGVDAGDHSYYVTYEQVDHNGRIVEGRISAPSDITLGAAADVNVTVDNLLQGSGWNTNGAVVNGAQVSVNTITVDDGSLNVHSMQVGDFAYFRTSGGTYVTREITAVSAFTITIDGAPVSVDNNEPISNNLKINIYRTTAAAEGPFLIVTLANNSYAATTLYLDSTSDATAQLQRRYQFPNPGTEPDPPPLTSVVIPFGRQLIFTDDPVNDDFVYFSEAANPEYVPPLNNFIVPSNSDDVTGAGVSGATLLIFKDRSIYAINGDLITSQFTVTSIAPGSNIGCVNHHTIVSVGGLIYFLHTNGVYTIAESQLYPTDEFGNPIPISIMIDQIFREDNFINDKKFVVKRAVATNYTKDNQYLLFLPAEEKEGPRASNNNSRVLCYDYQGKNWFEWTRVDAGGGWYVLDDNLYWQDRKRKNNTITSKKYKQHRKYRLIDHVDHVTPTRVTWESSWEDLGQPRVRKKFVRSILLFDDISALFQQNIPTLCFTSYKDWVEGRESTRTNIMQKINSSKWSTSHWSWLQWSGYQDSFITIPLRGGTVAKSLKISLQLNTINSTFRLQGFQQEISPDFRKTVVR